MACIYKIRNLVNEKFYIGGTIRPKHIRKYEHFSELRKNEHCNPYLQNAFNKYGEENFVFEIVEIVNFPENLDRKQQGVFLVAKEAYFVQLLKPEYNLRKDITSTGKIGFTCSEETKRKISESNLKRFEGKELAKSTLEKRDREVRRKQGNLYPNKPKFRKIRGDKPGRPKGLKHSQEAINKIIERSNKEDNKLRIREIQKIASKNRIGTHQSIESKIKSMITKFGQNRQINIYNKQGEFISSCNFSLEASEITGVGRSNISNNLAGLSKSAGGYTFKYSS